MKRVWKSMDYSLLLPLVILCVLGVIMVYSSSSIVAISSKYNWPADHFFKKQLVSLAIGTVMLVIVAVIPYKFWRKKISSCSYGIRGYWLTDSSLPFW